MTVMSAFSNASTGKKVIAVAALAAGTYVLYSLLSEKSAQAASKKLPALNPEWEKLGVAVEEAGFFPEMASQLFVVKAYDGSRLVNLRSGPSRKLPIVDAFVNGAVVKGATGRIVTDTMDPNFSDWIEFQTSKGYVWGSSQLIRPIDPKLGI